jgi:hypothetical protein
MYEDPTLERLGTFRQLTQDDSPCEGTIEHLLLGGDDNGDDNGVSCISGA